MHECIGDLALIEITSDGEGTISRTYIVQSHCGHPSQRNSSSPISAEFNAVPPSVRSDNSLKAEFAGPRVQRWPGQKGATLRPDVAGVVRAIEHVERGNASRQHLGVLACRFGEAEVLAVEQVQRSHATRIQCVSPYSGRTCVPEARVEVVVARRFGIGSPEYRVAATPSVSQ